MISERGWGWAWAHRQLPQNGKKLLSLRIIIRDYWAVYLESSYQKMVRKINIYWHFSHNEPDIKCICLKKKIWETSCVIPYSEAALEMHFLGGDLLNPSGLNDTCQPLCWQPNQIHSCCWSLPAFPYKKHKVLCFLELFSLDWEQTSASLPVTGWSPP